MTKHTEGTAFDPEHYDRMATGTVPGYVALQDLVALAAAAMAPASSTVLDLGCGTGTGLLALRRALPDAHLIACDPVAPMVAAARTRCEAAGVIAELVVGELSTISHDVQFDVVVCTLVLHFVPPDERVAFLSAIRARLRPGGVLVISVLGRATEPPVQAVWAQVRDHYASSRGSAPVEIASRAAETGRRVHPVSPDELRAAFASAGFALAAPLYQLLAVHCWLAGAEVFA